MRFHETAIAGAFVVELTPHEDARGSFARVYCEQAFADAGIAFRPVQVNLSRNPLPFTLRGMHYQHAPHGEAKYVHCVAGRLFDVAVDLRPGSPSYLKHVGVELVAGGNRLFYIPDGCAHGYLTLEPDSALHYQVSHPYVAAAGAGVRWDDPVFDITWPAVPQVINPRDAGYPDYRPG
jgi:dTDP-4-dehydrorhamnose 3,5-epimerase